MTKEGADRLDLHEMHLENRSRLSVSGVKEVESFDENTILLQTVRGMLIVRGEGLQLLVMTEQELRLTGKIAGIELVE